MLTPEFLQFAKANPTAKPFRVAVSVNVGGKQVPFVLLVGDKTVNDAIAAEKAGRALAVDSVQFNSLFPGRPFPGDAGVVFRP
ncbi:MAG: hypothetical protein HY075_05620 [Deltaproteobacteria bacterium]|nr:hypothetical protein [Deltaproteobacteria bacterium]